MNWKSILAPLAVSFVIILSGFFPGSAIAANQTSVVTHRELRNDIQNSSLIADANCEVAFPKPRNQKIDPDPNLDGKRFVKILRDKLPLDEHMGYIVVLQNSDLRNVAWDASGYAISNCDPDGPQAFTVDTRTAWGSVSKLITASVVANLAQDSDQVDLSDRFAPYMPNRWSLNPKFQQVTFAQLLGHRAGLRKSAGAPLRERLAKTFSDDPPVGKHSYSNTGAGIAGRMIMRAVSPGGAQAWERQHIRDSQQDYDDEFNKWASFYYLGFADSKVLSPSNIDWEEDASCNINQFKDNGRPYARRYRSGKDPNGRLFSDQSLSCFSGGWVMSARHMARFMRTLRHTNAIVNRETYANMATCRLGFDTGGDGYVRGPAIHKDGLITGNGYRYAAYVVMLPGGYTAVAASNSGSSSALRVAVRDAFNASYSPPLDQIGVENPGGKCVYL
jgi:CubicO group peptidase (beta-lactamase class C family)